MKRISNKTTKFDIFLIEKKKRFHFFKKEIKRAGKEKASKKENNASLYLFQTYNIMHESMSSFKINLY